MSWNSLVQVLAVCFTSQISARYIIYTIVVCTVLILLLEKSHLDNIYYLQQQENLYRQRASNMADRELQERIRQFYQTSNVHTTLHNITEQNRFTIILQTYNRTDILVRLLNHYSAVARLDKIIVVWNNIDELPPFELWMKFAPHPVPVVFLKQEENKMRNRLKPFSEIETKGVCLQCSTVIVSPSGHCGLSSETCYQETWIALFWVTSPTPAGLACLKPQCSFIGLCFTWLP